MPEFKVAVLFTAIDQLSDKLSAIGGALEKFTGIVTTGSEHVHALGERMVEWGEKVGVVSAVLSEGASKLHEWSEAMEEPALSMERNMATMAAMTRLSGKALAGIKERAVDFASVHPGVTAEEWVTGFTRMRGIFQETTRAMQAEDTVAMLGRLGVESDAATRLIQVGWSHLHSTTAATGYQLTRAIQAFGLTPEQANQFAMAVGRMGASASAAHAPFSEVLALAGKSSQLLGGGRDAMIFTAMIQGLEKAAAQGKVTIDFSYGLISALQQLKAQLSGTPTEKLAELADMGLGAQGPQLLKLLDNLDEVATKQKQIAAGTGALSKAYGVATSDAADQIQLLHQNVSNLYDAIYSPVLPMVNRWFSDLAGVARGAAGATEHHSTIAHYAALSLTTMGGAAYYSLQGLSALGTMSAFAGKGVQALSGLLDMQSHYLRVLYLWDHIKSVGTAIIDFGSSLLSAIPSITSFGAALLASPLTWYIARAVAIGRAAYKIYEHWGAVSAFFEGLWTRIKGALSGFETWFKAWGPTLGEVLVVALTGPLRVAAIEVYKHWDSIRGTFSDAWDSIKEIFSGSVDWLRDIGTKMVQALGDGIKAAAAAPMEAVKWLAGKIMSFLPHAPAGASPLRDLNRVRIFETIAENIQPAPMVASMSNTAAAIMRAMPTLTWPTVLAPISMPAAVASPPALPAPPAMTGWEPVPLKIPVLHAPEIPTPRIPALPILHTSEIALPAVVTTATPMLAPLLSRAERRRSLEPLAAAPTVGTTINLNLHYAPVINGVTPADWNPRKQADEIMRIVKDKLTREARLRFE